VGRSAIGVVDCLLLTPPDWNAFVTGSWLSAGEHNLPEKIFKALELNEITQEMGRARGGKVPLPVSHHKVWRRRMT
jgi:hypothetical protein